MNAWMLLSWDHRGYLVRALQMLNVLQPGQSSTAKKLRHPSAQTASVEAAAPSLDTQRNLDSGWLGAGSILKPRLFCPHNSVVIRWQHMEYKQQRNLTWCYIFSLLKKQNLNPVILLPTWPTFLSPVLEPDYYPPSLSMGPDSTYLPPKHHMRWFLSLDVEPAITTGFSGKEMVVCRCQLNTVESWCPTLVIMTAVCKCPQSSFQTLTANFAGI